MRTSAETTTAYRAYTTKFDREVAVQELDTVLGPLSSADAAAVDDAWHAVQTGLLGWRTHLHIAAAEASQRIRAKLGPEERADTAVTLLFDQSGSMRGQKMLFAAATADVVREFLLTLKLRCEVLGFTTSRWLGGRSRRRWRWRLSPANPGRLNDLLHIIYADARDERTSTGGWAFRQMLRPDLPKENVDGEALLWAAARLSAQPAKRKLLIILSDGAPVDDSTLLQNGPTYLADHLRHVVEGLVAEGDIEIAAMGIGYRAHDFYPVARHVEAPDELGSALLSLIEFLLLS